jgi:hypothetical protein
MDLSRRVQRSRTALGPAEEAALRNQADEAGVPLEEFVRQVLERESKRPTRYHPKVEASLKTIEKLRGKLGPVLELALDPEFLYGRT